VRFATDPLLTVLSSLHASRAPLPAALDMRDGWAQLKLAGGL